MSSRGSSLAAMNTIAVALGDLVDRVVFVGGTVVALYPLEDGSDVRPTDDVDCIVNIATTGQYYAFVAQLRARGFKECTDQGAPICRQVYAGIRVDVMPTEATAIGPTNEWYADAMDAAASYDVGNVRVRAITPEYFVATKLEAFRSRGQGDYVASHDLEDVLGVLGGMLSLRNQITVAELPIHEALRRELVALMTKDAFVEAVPGHFEGHAIGQARGRDVLQWLRALRAT